ncbi:hypothetical protein KCV07_g25, partial [Aureobasidium melanogenum]
MDDIVCVFEEYLVPHALSEIRFSGSNPLLCWQSTRCHQGSDWDHRHFSPKIDHVFEIKHRIIVDVFASNSSFDVAVCQ